MDTRKEQERAELHRVIWNIANDLRGSIDGWDFTQYVLGMSSNRISIKTLDLNCDFSAIAAQLNRIAEEQFGFSM